MFTAVEIFNMTTNRTEIYFIAIAICDYTIITSLDTYFKTLTESLQEAPQISLGLPEQGYLHSCLSTGTNFESSFPQ